MEAKPKNPTLKWGTLFVGGHERWMKKCMYIYSNHSVIDMKKQLIMSVRFSYSIPPNGIKCQCC